MALTATLYQVFLSLSDADRGVYEAIEMRVPRHPSESMSYFVTRLLAYGLEYAEGIAFSSGGVSDREDPTLSVRDLTGRIVTWIEIGAPSVERMHLAAKRADRAAIYTARDAAFIASTWGGQKIHRGDEVAVFALPASVVGPLSADEDRRVRWDVTRSGGELYVTRGTESFHGALEERHPFARS